MVQETWLPVEESYFRFELRSPLKGFNYMDLDSETRVVVQQRTSKIKILVKLNAQDIVDIGQKLIVVKDKLG